MFRRAFLLLFCLVLAVNGQVVVGFSKPADANVPFAQFAGPSWLDRVSPYQFRAPRRGLMASLVAQFLAQRGPPMLALGAPPGLVGGWTKPSSGFQPVHFANLIVWVPFSDGSGATLTDGLGLGQTGTLVGSPTWITGPGAPDGGYGVTFNGSSQYGYLNNTTGVANGLATFSVSIWFKTTATGTDHDGDDVLFAKIGNGEGDPANAPGWCVQRESAGVNTICFDNTPNTDYVEIQEQSKSDGAWHNLISTFTGMPSAPAMTGYIDGTAISTANLGNGTFTGAYNNTYPITLAINGNPNFVLDGSGGSGASAEYFAGSLAALRIYNIVLTQTDATGISGKTE